MTYLHQALRGLSHAIIASAFLVSSTVFAQEDSDTGAKGKNSLFAGSKAFLFEVDGFLNIDIDGFSGATISYKFHTSSRKAYRIGLSLSGSLFDGDVATSRRSSRIDFVTPDTIESVTNSGGPNDREDLNLEINVVRLFYSSTLKRVTGFIGLGPAIGIRRSSLYSSVVDIFPSSINPTLFQERLRIRDETNNAWDIGVHGLVGVEWFMRDNISLMSEFGTTLAYAWSKFEGVNISKTEIYDIVTGPITEREDSTISASKQRGISLRYSVVRLGLSIYF